MAYSRESRNKGSLGLQKIGVETLERVRGRVAKSLSLCPRALQTT